MRFNVFGKGIFFFGLFFSTLGLHPAVACLAYKPISKSDYLDALIVRADIEEYVAYSNRMTAIVTLHIKEVLQGSSKLGAVTAIWINDSQGVPPRWTRPKQIIAGLKLSDRVSVPVYQIVQTPCSGVGLLSDDPGNLQNIREITLENRKN